MQYKKSLLLCNYLKSKSLNSLHLWWNHFLQSSQPISLTVSEASFSKTLHGDWSYIKLLMSKEQKDKTREDIIFYYEYST